MNVISQAKPEMIFLVNSAKNHSWEFANLLYLHVLHGEMFLLPDQGSAVIVPASM